MPTNKPRALVTGASAGIGAAFARRLARDGYDLILVARRHDRLEALSRELGGAEVLSADLTSDADLKTIEFRLAADPPVDLLVNNAGFGVEGLFWNSALDAQDQMHRLHILATLRLTHAALRAMVPRGHGAIINVSSVAGFGQSPGSVSYCATKTWMNSFTEGIDLELKSANSPVKMQALCPGFTYSEFHEAAGIDRKRFPAWLWMQAEEVVDESLAGLARGKLFVVPGNLYKALVVVERIIPKWLHRAGARRYARTFKRA